MAPLFHRKPMRVSPWLQFSVVGFRSQGLPVQQPVRAAPAVRKHQPADCLRYRGILISLVGVRHAGVDGRLIIER